jgi:hypothetical protein
MYLAEALQPRPTQTHAPHTTCLIVSIGSPLQEFQEILFIIGACKKVRGALPGGAHRCSAVK